MVSGCPSGWRVHKLFVFHSLRLTTIGWNPALPNPVLPQLSRRTLLPDGQLAAFTKTVWSKFGSWILSFKTISSPAWTEGGSELSQTCIWAPCASWMCPKICSFGRRSESRARRATQPVSLSPLFLSNIWYGSPCVNLEMVRLWVNGESVARTRYRFWGI